MGEAILSGSLKRFFILINEKDAARQEYLYKKYHLKSQRLAEIAKVSDVIILAVKPQDIDTVLGELSTVLKKETLVISIAAGVTTNFIEKALGKNPRVVRTMPNLPATIGEGVTALCPGRFAKTTDMDLARKIFSNVGDVVTVSENQIDAITAVSGSGPAYVFFFMECLMKSAKALGLEEKLARQLVEKTFLGSVHLLLKQKMDARDLRAKVTSKGGTTQAALEVFFKQNVEKIFTNALKAAKKRASKLSRS